MAGRATEDWEWKCYQALWNKCAKLRYAVRGEGSAGFVGRILVANKLGRCQVPGGWKRCAVECCGVLWSAAECCASKCCRVAALYWYCKLTSGWTPEGLVGYRKVQESTGVSVSDCMRLYGTASDWKMLLPAKSFSIRPAHENPHYYIVR